MVKNCRWAVPIPTRSNRSNDRFGGSEFMLKHILTPAGWVIGMGFMLVTISDTAMAQDQPTKAPAPAAAKAPAPTAAKAPAPAAATKAPAYKQPMTSWGEPDISG